MKKYNGLIKVLVSFLLLIISILLYLLSDLLKVVFKPWFIILLGIIIISLMVCEIIFKKINKEKINKIFKVVNEYLQILLSAFVIVEVIFAFFMFPATVLQNSMLPTLFPNDKLIVQRTNDIDNNDIIVFEYNNEIQKNNVGVSNHELLIKRVIVKEGQTFSYVDNKLYIDGIVVEDKFVVEEMNGLSLKDICEQNNMINECLQEDGSYKVPEGWFVVFGDNRAYSPSKTPLSIDSRTFGLVHESQIYGKVKYQIDSIFKWNKI